MPPAVIYLFKVSIETPELSVKYVIGRSGVFIVNFEHISPLVLVFLFLTLNMELLAGLQNIGTLLVISEIIRLSLRKKYPNTEFFLVLSSCIRTEYEDLRSKSPLVRTRENTDQKNLRIWTVLTLF